MANISIDLQPTVSVLDRFRPDGRTAIVTGGNRGIGRGISDALAGAGANVVVASRDASAGERAAAEIAEATGADTRAVSADTTDEDAVRSPVATTVSALGGVDILVNNAGVTVNTPALEMSVEGWSRVVEVNLTCAFNCAKFAARAMADGDGGSIINVSSISAFMTNPRSPRCRTMPRRRGWRG